MKNIKQGCFIIIFIILISITISSFKEYYLAKRTSIDEETTKVVEQKKETKYYELDFIGVKRLKKDFGDSLLKAFNSIDENNEEEFTEQMKAIDDILTELELKKKVGVHEEVKKLYDFL